MEKDSHCTHSYRVLNLSMPTDNVPAAMEAAGTPAKRKETAAQGIIDKALRVAMRTRQQLYEPCSCVALHVPQNRTPETARYQWDRSCKSIDEHFARRAFMDDGVMIAFQKKRLPDLKGGEDLGSRPILIQIVNYGVGVEPER